MFYKEIKNLLNELNSENIKELKPSLIRKVNELILKINDDDISDSELEELCNFFIMREEFRKEASKENSLIEGLLIENFIKAFDEFIDEISNKDYIADAIELINSLIRSIGGIARGFRLVKKYAPPKEVNSIQYLIELKDEFYKQLRSYSSKGIYEEQFVICGLINIIKFEFKEDEVKISAEDKDEGSIEERVPSVLSGDPLDIVFNCFYVADILKHSSGNNIILHLLKNGPMLVEQENDKDYQYVVTPMRGR